MLAFQVHVKGVIFYLSNKLTKYFKSATNIMMNREVWKKNE